MGCQASVGNSERNPNVYELYPNLEQWKDQFESLQLENDYLLGLNKMFLKIDHDKSGTIEIMELLNFLDVDRSRFTVRVFSIFDEDSSGTVDFREFVISMWNYCTLSKHTLVLFAFDMYDRDSSGEIDFKEMMEMLKDVYGFKKYLENKQALRTMEQIQSLGDGSMQVEEFREFVRTHPAMLYPALNMQTMIQTKVLGIKFWAKYAEKRLELSNGAYVSIGELMELHISKGALRNVLSDSKDPRFVRPVDESVIKHLEVTGAHHKRTRRASHKSSPNNHNINMTTTLESLKDTGSTMSVASNGGSEGESVAHQHSHHGQHGRKRKPAVDVWKNAKNMTKASNAFQEGARPKNTMMLSRDVLSKQLSVESVNSQYSESGLSNLNSKFRVTHTAIVAASAFGKFPASRRSSNTQGDSQMMSSKESLYDMNNTGHALDTMTHLHTNTSQTTLTSSTSTMASPTGHMSGGGASMPDQYKHPGQLKKLKTSNAASASSTKRPMEAGSFSDATGWKSTK